jgi:membrane protease YdiL (CAAX protease family)
VSAQNEPIAQAVGQADAALATVVVSAIVNGTFEEVFLLGFLLRGLKRYGVAVALGMSLLVRLLFHSYQGVYGMLAVVVFGLVLSVYYLRTQALFPVTFAHILADIVPFTGLLE